MNVLLSIKPEFATKILQGQKEYEFRKTVFRDPEIVNKAFLYASSPVQQIVGSFTIGEIVAASPNELWDRFGEDSGIENRKRFMDYFSGKERGYAIEVCNPSGYSDPVQPTRYFEDFHPPMSFQYIESELEVPQKEVTAAD